MSSNKFKMLCCIIISSTYDREKAILEWSLSSNFPSDNLKHDFTYHGGFCSQKYHNTSDHNNHIWLLWSDVLCICGIIENNIVNKFIK